MKFWLIWFVQFVLAGGLELRFRPDKIVGGMPQGFTFQLVNTGTRDVRLPEPAIQCSSADNGTISLELEFIPLQAFSDGSGGGCGGGIYDGPPILERAKGWKLLHPGDVLTLTAPKQPFFYRDSEPGTYRFSARYTPPVFSPHDRQRLMAAGIIYPLITSRTAALEFVKTRSREAGSQDAHGAGSRTP